MQDYSPGKFYLDFLKRHWFLYTVGILAVVITTFGQVFWVRSMGWVIDFFSEKEIPGLFVGADRSSTFANLFGPILFTRFVLFFSRVVWRLILARRTHFSAKLMRELIWENARYFPMPTFANKYSKGVLMNITNSDINQARFIFGFTIVMLVDVFSLGLLSLFMLAKIDLELTLWGFCCLLFLPPLMVKLSTKEIDLYEQSQEMLSRLNDFAAQTVATIRLQRLTQSGAFWQQKLCQSAEQVRASKLQAVKTSLAYIPLMGGGAIISYAVLFYLGIQKVLSGQLSVGDFIAMQGLMLLLIDPLCELGFIISDWKKGMASLGRIIQVFNQPKEEFLQLGQDPLLASETILSVKDLSFSYPTEKAAGSTVLKNINLHIRRGQRIGITGKIGTGKSTLLQILAGLERGHRGSVTFLGKSFHAYRHRTLREHIGLVPQKPFLFADSIRNNVKMDLALSDDEVEHFLQLAELKNDAQGFAHYLDTELGEWGINLSGGQKQRLALARALARRPKVLFLDDCLSAVDTVTEEKILKNLHRALSSTTLIWVAHRSSTLKYCHEVIKL